MTKEHMDFNAIRQMHIEGVLDGIDDHIKRAGKLLKIKIPEIVVVNYQYDYAGQHKIANSYYDEMLQGDPAMGYYVPEVGIVLSLMDPYKRTVISDADLLVNIIHELRHVWQYTYHRDAYYTKNAVGAEGILDMAEIDADAYALRYMEKYTLFNSYSYGERIRISMDLDDGARAERMSQIKYL